MQAQMIQMQAQMIQMQAHMIQMQAQMIQNASTCDPKCKACLIKSLMQARKD